jgi:hypothetical protein
MRSKFLLNQKIKGRMTRDESNDWVGFDLDGTLAQYERGKYREEGPSWIGEPVPAMVERVKQHLKNGDRVKIMTARVAEEDSNLRLEVTFHIEKWCEKHIGQRLEITCVKDMHMVTLYDDRARQVEFNTGRVIGED